MAERVTQVVENVLRSDDNDPNVRVTQVVENVLRSDGNDPNIRVTQVVENVLRSDGNDPNILVTQTVMLVLRSEPIGVRPSLYVDTDTFYTPVVSLGAPPVGVGRSFAMIF